MNEIRPNNPNPSLNNDSSINQRSQDQTRNTQQQDQVNQADDNKKAQEMQEAQFKKAATEALRMSPEPTSINQDFLSVIDTISKEIYETPKSSAGGKSGDSDSGNMNSKQGMGAQSQKDLQIMKEFLREANYLIKNQNMDVSQMLNTLKVEQGGVFWSKVQEVLQKGLPLTQTVVFQNVDKNFQEISKQFMGLEWKGTLNATANEAGEMQPGKAILEIIKAESNPQGAMEHYMSALQILMKDGMQVSAQKLVSYLKRRSGLSDQSSQAYHWAGLLRKDIVAPHPEKLERDFAHFWYIIISLGSFGALTAMGFDWLASLLVGLSIGVVIFVFSFVLKK